MSLRSNALLMKSRRRKQLAVAEKQGKAAAKERAKAEAEANAANPEEFLKKLGEARSSSNQLVALSDLGKLVEAPLKKAFMAYWSAALDSGSLPPGVGSLSVQAGKANDRKLFLLSDVVPSLAAKP